MSKQTEQYFLISLEHLPAKQEIFPFNLHIYNPLTDSYSLFLHANSPLDKNKRTFIQMLENKSGSLAISLRQKKTFLYATNIDPKKIPGLTPYEKHPLEKAQEIYKLQFEKKREEREENPYLYKIELKRAILDNNFSTLIEEVRSEILTFSYNKTPTLSLAIFLCETLLTKDNRTNRIVVFSFILAKELKIKDEEILGQIICSAYLHHLGFMNLNRSYQKIPYQHLPEKEKSYFRRHGGLTQHLLKKIGLEIDSSVIDNILQHHERIDGKGYPYMKTEASISLNAQIIGVVSHLFDLQAGQISTEKVPLLSSIGALISGTNILGLENKFSQCIIESLESIYKVTEQQLSNSKGEEDGA